MVRLSPLPDYCTSSTIRLTGPPLLRSGSAGIKTPGFANVATTPRDSSRRKAEGLSPPYCLSPPRCGCVAHPTLVSPYALASADTSVIRDDSCGKTAAGGKVDIPSVSRPSPLPPLDSACALMRAFSADCARA